MVVTGTTLAAAAVVAGPLEVGAGVVVVAGAAVVTATGTGAGGTKKEYTLENIVVKLDFDPDVDAEGVAVVVTAAVVASGNSASLACTSCAAFRSNSAVAFCRE